MAIQLKRAYDPPEETDGERLMVDRLWPRGLRKEAAHLSAWLKDLAPREELRRWFAHDPSRPELNEWFNRLASGRGLCCSFADGFAVSDVDWESKDGHYRVRLENNWIDVPAEALITEPNRAGRTMVWPLRFNGQIVIHCFMPGSMG